MSSFHSEEFARIAELLWKHLNDDQFYAVASNNQGRWENGGNQWATHLQKPESGRSKR